MKVRLLPLADCPHCGVLHYDPGFKHEAFADADLDRRVTEATLKVRARLEPGTFPVGTLVAVSIHSHLAPPHEGGEGEAGLLLCHVDLRALLGTGLKIPTANEAALVITWEQAVSATAGNPTNIDIRG